MFFVRLRRRPTGLELLVSAFSAFSKYKYELLAAPGFFFFIIRSVRYELDNSADIAICTSV